MKMIEVPKKSMDHAMVSQPVESEMFRPTLTVHDVPIPAEAQVGDKVKFVVEGKVVGMSQHKSYSSIEIEVHAVGYDSPEENDYTKMAEEDEA